VIVSQTKHGKKLPPREYGKMLDSLLEAFSKRDTVLASLVTKFREARRMISYSVVVVVVVVIVVVVFVVVVV